MTDRHDSVSPHPLHRSPGHEEHWYSFECLASACAATVFEVRAREYLSHAHCPRCGGLCDLRGYWPETEGGFGSSTNGGWVDGNLLRDAERDRDCAIAALQDFTRRLLGVAHAAEAGVELFKKDQ